MNIADLIKADPKLSDGERNVLATAFEHIMTSAHLVVDQEQKDIAASAEASKGPFGIAPQPRRVYVDVEQKKLLTSAYDVIGKYLGR